MSSGCLTLHPHQCLQLHQAPEPSTDAFGMPVMSNDSPFGTPANGFPPAAAPPAVAGVNAFDEALGKIPAGSSPAPQFTAFDAAFDDNFDFGSASAAATTETAFPPAPTFSPASAMRVRTSLTASSLRTVRRPSPESPKPNGSNIPNFGASPISQPSQNGSAAGGAATSFRRGVCRVRIWVKRRGFERIPQLTHHGDGAKWTAVKRTAASLPLQSPLPLRQRVLPRPEEQPNVPFHPPPRHRSPPPPKGSKGRPSTSSSKEEKTKDSPPTRSSKLSIRLPFGRKKNKPAEPLPAGPSHLTPPREEPESTGTPGLDDDVEAVKQLTAMGFSRVQAVDALEVSGYDVQKALNSLLNLNAQ
ncbi:hypothetical protein MSAN_01283800 [Mycena sanguinolenta]|uniref:UBA domain-containing protein n=1 Tax=Mycena sanguinolenta TaxID=230812 RepID=A0A8H7D4U9_9AGAR|nr:hypothetical protein MSAN_01283800 [Mycena sanguinolenta]